MNGETLGYIYEDTKDISCHDGYTKPICLALSKNRLKVLVFRDLPIINKSLCFYNTYAFISFKHHSHVLTLCHLCEPDSFSNIPLWCFGIYFVSTRCKQQCVMAVQLLSDYSLIKITA